MSNRASILLRMSPDLLDRIDRARGPMARTGFLIDLIERGLARLQPMTDEVGTPNTLEFARGPASHPAGESSDSPSEDPADRGYSFRPVAQDGSVEGSDDAPITPEDWIPDE